MFHPVIRSCAVLCVVMLGACGAYNTVRGGLTGAPPGLEGLYAEREAQAEAERDRAEAQRRVAARDGAVAARTLGFPPALWPSDVAEQRLAGDPVALRFLTARVLEDKGLLTPEDAAQRRMTNLGALLPLTKGPSSLGLSGPVPPVAETIARLSATTRDYPQTASFLMEGILPVYPVRKEPLQPKDQRAARAMIQRLPLLQDAGLISVDEGGAELQALNRLITSGALPETAPETASAVDERPASESVAPPPKPKPKVKGTHQGNSRSQGGGARRRPGGVSGQLVVIPSPDGVVPSPLAANATGPAGIYLLSVPSPSLGPVGWEGLTRHHPELASLDWVLEKVEIKDVGTTYRLVAGPVDAARARSLCTALSAQGQQCLPVAFPKGGIKPQPAVPPSNPDPVPAASPTASPTASPVSSPVGAP